MNCPLFVDYIRECYKKIGYMPQDSYNYCLHDTHVRCPFYIKINNTGIACEYIDNCPVYKKFGMGNFDKFVHITQNFCLSKNKTACARYKIRKSNEIPAPNLLPDGTISEEEK